MRSRRSVVGKASPPASSTSRCSGVWRLVRCEYEALRRGVTLDLVIMGSSSRYSSYNCLTSWDSYDRIPRFAFILPPAVAVFFRFGFSIVFLTSTYLRPLHLVCRIRYISLPYFPLSVYLILLIVSCHSLSLFIFNEPDRFSTFISLLHAHSFTYIAPT